MTVFLIFVFLGLLLACSVVCEAVADWLHKSDAKFYVFLIGVLYVLIVATPTFFLGIILWRRLQ